MPNPKRDVYIIEAPVIDVSLTVPDPNTVVRRIDYFAGQVIAGLTADRVARESIIREEQETGKPREQILADRAYDIAIAMQAKSETV